MWVKGVFSHSRCNSGAILPRLLFVLYSSKILRKMLIFKKLLVTPAHFWYRYFCSLIVNVRNNFSQICWIQCRNNLFFWDFFVFQSSGYLRVFSVSPGLAILLKEYKYINIYFCVIVSLLDYENRYPVALIIFKSFFHFMLMCYFSKKNKG